MHLDGVKPIKSLKAWRPIKRLAAIPMRYLTLPLAVWCFIGFVLLSARHTQWADIIHIDSNYFRPSPPQMPLAKPVRPLTEPVPCYGARGHLLSQSPDDELRYGNPGVVYPVPFSGSHRDLGLQQTWMTADGRYGPYGFGEEKSTYNRSRVDWDKVDWGRLQDKCLQRNAHRFPDEDIPTTRVASDMRFTLLNQTNLKPAPFWNEFPSTRRTAIVIRAFQGFEYKAEVMWFIRSLITEASLRTGGEYVVVLLVNIQDRNDIFASRENYDQAMEEANIPPELRSITLLWDDGLLQSWYAAVEEHRTMWQVNQPFQLFSLHYPEFDHYWQIELDQRFMGDAGQYLDAIGDFARYEPRKQALERSTFSYSEQVSGTYENFTRQVSDANKGKSVAWGPVAIPDVPAIGPQPPFGDIEDDDFWWGVGEDADVIVTGFCADVRNADWSFRDYIVGFKNGIETPRWWCPPAVMRGSRSLLLSIHKDQLERGMSIPSEASMPTWALWLGLKFSAPPFPAYMHAYQENSEFLDETSRLKSQWHKPDEKPWFGYSPNESPDGFGHGAPASFADRGNTWWWVSNYPRRVMDVWLNNEVDASDMPSMLAVHDGQVYSPNFAMHPVKT